MNRVAELSRREFEMLWIIVVGLVAGILARLLSSAPNKPTGFLLTTR